MIDKIAFLVHSKELLNHFSCIWDALPQDSFDVLLHGEADLPAGEAFAPWHCQVFHTTDILGKKLKYRYLVSNHPVDTSGEPLIKRLAQVNVRFMYAAGKSGWNLSSWNALYDVILCFGPYHAGYFSRHTKATIVQIGYPRLDRYFTSPSDAAALSSSLGCAPDKKTVVWLPTHGAVSSLGHFNEEIAALTERNVLVKVHPLTPRSDPAAIDALSQLPFTRLIVDSTDNLPLYQIADYMLFDYGGPPLAGIYTNKKMILLNIPGAEQDALIGRHSPDALRNYIIAVEPQMQAIAGLLENDSVFMVIWLIGLSGSGKTTLGKEIARLWRGLAANTVLLDGDELRRVFAHDQTDAAYSVEGRRANAERMTALCEMLDRRINVVCCILSLFPDMRTQNRERFSRYFEVFMDASMEALLRRDTKGLYQDALTGARPNVVGVDIPFPRPETADLTISTSGPEPDMTQLARHVLGKAGIA